MVGGCYKITHYGEWMLFKKELSRDINLGELHIYNLPWSRLLELRNVRQNVYEAIRTDKISMAMLDSGNSDMVYNVRIVYR